MGRLVGWLVRSSYHSDQMSQRSQVSRNALQKRFSTICISDEVTYRVDLVGTAKETEQNISATEWGYIESGQRKMYTYCIQSQIYEV